MKDARAAAPARHRERGRRRRSSSCCRRRRRSSRARACASTARRRTPSASGPRSAPAARPRRSTAFISRPRRACCDDALSDSDRMPALDARARHRAATRSPRTARHTLALDRALARASRRARARRARRRRRCSSKRGQLLPRERVARLLDPGVPFLELSTLAGWLQDSDDPERSVPGGGAICGIGVVCRRARHGRRRRRRHRRRRAAAARASRSCCARSRSRSRTSCRSCTWSNRRAPTCSSTASSSSCAAAALFCNLARLSAAGLPVIAVVHGSSTAGGAYMTGLADHVIMVRGRARAFLAGPPLLKAATGEIATDEELGGADMHAERLGPGRVRRRRRRERARRPRAS